jgi:hypothetical protein
VVVSFHRFHFTKNSSALRQPTSLGAGRLYAYGKIQGCMETLPKVKTEAPPPLIGTFIKGFNIVAGRVWLILPPVFLDLFLWFGPHLSLKDLLSPLYIQVITEIVKTTGVALPANFKTPTELTQATLGSSNLMTALRSYPIGIPSLMAMASPVVNPLGIPMIYQVPSAEAALLAWLGLTLVGVLFGSLYFSALSKAAGSAIPGAEKTHPGSRFGQVLLFTLLFYAAIFFIGFPVMFMLGLVSMVNPSVGQIVFMVGFFLVLWFLMPLVFSPFGIFTSGQKVIPSIMVSFKLVRGYLRGTGFFVLIAILLEVILDKIWIEAPANSWLMLVSIFGHAFISTALITSTFVYYLAGMRWMQIRSAVTQTITAA